MRETFWDGNTQMSMVFYSFIGELPDSKKWQDAVDRFTLPFKFEPDFDLSNHPGGLILCFWKGVETTVELWVRSIDAAPGYDLNEIALTIEPRRRKFFVIFRWGADWHAACSALAACVGLIAGYDAAVYSSSDACFTDIDELVLSIREIESSCAENSISTV